MKAKYYIIILFLISLVCGCIRGLVSVEVKEGSCDYSLEDHTNPVSFSVQNDKIVINHVATYVCGGMELKADINLTGNQIFVNEWLQLYELAGGEYGATSCFCPRNNTLTVGPVARGTYDVVLIYGGEEIKRFIINII